MSRQMVGDLACTFATLDDLLEAGRPVSEMVRGHLLTSRCFLHWIAADRAGLERTGRGILAYPWSREPRLLEIVLELRLGQVVTEETVKWSPKRR